MTDARQMISQEDVAPQGKRWVCCTACQGMGRVLLDVTEPPAVRPPSTPVDKDSPVEERRRPNNPFGPRGTLRCLNCQRRKKKCSFETIDSACLRCRLRSLDCGPKLPPQQRPRSITSVPADYARPLSLTIDTTRATPLSDGYDTPGSAASFDSMGLHSLPVSPFLMPLPVKLEGGSTAMGGSPSSLHLDRFEQGITFNFNRVENGGLNEFAAPMSHQTSQQTVVPQREMFPASGAVQYIPSLDPNNEMTDAITHELEQTHPFNTPYMPLPSQENASILIPSESASQWTPFPNALPQQPRHVLPQRSSPSHPPPHCGKCGTVQTPQWRKNQLGDIICEKCGEETHITNVPSTNHPNPGPGQGYWRNKFTRMETPSFNSFMSDETNGTGTQGSSQGPDNRSQESEEMLLFEMQI